MIGRSSLASSREAETLAAAVEPYHRQTVRAVVLAPIHSFGRCMPVRLHHSGTDIPLRH